MCKELVDFKLCTGVRMQDNFGVCYDATILPLLLVVYFAVNYCTNLGVYDEIIGWNLLQIKPWMGGSLDINFEV